MGFGELVIILFVIGLILAPIGAVVWVVYAIARGKEEARLKADAVRGDEIAELRRRLDEAERQLNDEEEG